MNENVRVLFIAGESRSGTTILEKTIGSSPDVISLGETRYLLKRGLLELEPCGCGQRLDQCSFWRSALDGILDPDDKVSCREWLAIQQEVDPPGKFVSSPLAIKGSEFLNSQSGRRYVGFLRSLYTSIARVSGKSIIMESSKSPATAYAIRAAVGPDCFSMLHVTRHPCAVAYSLARRKKQWPTSTGSKVMTLYPWYKAAARWVAVNRILRRGDYGKSRHFLSYESFVSSPKESLEKAFQNFELKIDLQHISGTSVTTKKTHSVSGNPSRFTEGEAVILSDDTWKSELPRSQMAAILAITSVEKRHYGY